MIFIDWFDPAFKAGGPIVAAINFANNMNDDYQVFIYTGDRDLGDAQPLSGIETGKWVHWKENVSVFYSTLQQRSLSAIQTEIEAIQPGFIYLHSLFSKSFSIFPMILFRLGKIQCTMVVAPRGTLRSSALAHKSLKKAVFLKLFRGLGINKNLVFHATDETEERDILAHFGKSSKVITIPDFAARQPGYQSPPLKVTGELELIFVGRIHPIKNLDFVLNCLMPCTAKILLTVVGPIEDQEYWSQCSELIGRLPQNIDVMVKEGIQHAAVGDLVSRHDAFILPSKGENFGHAIYEALSIGRPVLISDQTPWLNLAEKKAGWDLPLQNPEAFTGIINKLSDMDAPELEKWCQGAWKYCKHYLDESDISSRYHALFTKERAEQIISG